MGRASRKGVTLITPTIRRQYIHRIFDNYARQQRNPKELIIILNKNSLRRADYLEQAKKYRHVRVYQLPERKSLGECLNFGVSKAKYRYIAKIDDDDYYSPNYISEAMKLLMKPKADLVGKESIYFYFPHSGKLLLRQRRHRPGQRVWAIAGATIMFNRRVFRRVKFAKAKQGTDALFIKDCLKQGYRIYTTSKYNFVAVRRADSRSHTWRITDKRLLASKNVRVVRTDDFGKIVNRNRR
ncbi:glycosyltransferase family 2 protein [Cohnella panacarvi]|uniref:glycosyltransferase family 2 protein n=1 Tax=Cohnella panacarvi TaxID=400776 RepID=UPI00047D5EC3|nr:glycosyltransferase family 2 protein [Cohnella panacarvi]